MGRKSELTSEPETPVCFVSSAAPHAVCTRLLTRAHAHTHTNRHAVTRSYTEAFTARRKFSDTNKQTNKKLGSVRRVMLLLRFAGYPSALTPEVAPNPTLTPSGLTHELCWDLRNIQVCPSRAVAPERIMCTRHQQRGAESVSKRALP